MNRRSERPAVADIPEPPGERNRTVYAMRTLLVFRHAKSSHADESLPDHDRPLTDRGRREAPHIGMHLLERDLDEPQ
ncbi:MAG: hypothetical protein KJZ69_10875 [Phycisphaerales bacterium]|nr:hypothetical protein [Phycisphaerales bacterium]